jgi:hypothetical protein
MANLTEDEINAMLADERERCALLAEDLAGRWERSAAKFRIDGTFNYGWLGRKKSVIPSVERAAKDTEAAAHGLRTVARGIREGWDTRKVGAGDGYAIATGVDGDPTMREIK